MAPVVVKMEPGKIKKEDQSTGKASGGKCNSAARRIRAKKYKQQMLAAEQYKQQMLAADQDRVDRTDLIEQWQNHASQLKQQVVTLKSTIFDRDETIKQLQMKARFQSEELDKLREQHARDQLTVSIHKHTELTIKNAREEIESCHKLLDEKDKKIEELRAVSMEITQSSIAEKSKATEEILECQEQLSEGNKRHSLEMEAVQNELEGYKRRVEDILSEEKERVWKICEEWDETFTNAMKEDHEREKKELEIEIKARHKALEIMVAKLHKVASDDEYFREKLEEIRCLL